MSSRPNTSTVIATANTPSLNASARRLSMPGAPVPGQPSAAVGLDGGTGGEAGGAGSPGGAGCAAWPDGTAGTAERASSRATSTTSSDSAASPAAFLALTASPSMTRQYGQAVEMVSGPVPSA